MKIPFSSNRHWKLELFDRWNVFQFCCCMSLTHTYKYSQYLNKIPSCKMGISNTQLFRFVWLFLSVIADDALWIKN